MTQIQRLGGWAALINPLIGLGMLIVAFSLIGVEAQSDPVRMATLAIHNPLPLLLQDGLKLVSAALAVVLVLALSDRLRARRPTLIRAANGFGFLSAGCLAINAVLSLFATTQAETFAATSPETGMQISGIIGLLAMVVILLNGPWYALTGWVALKEGLLPGGLCYLGLVMGVISLIPPLGIIVLVISLGWSIWLARTLLTQPNNGEMR